MGIIPDCAIAFVLAVMNIAAFCMMGYDKACARKGARRVSERTLFTASGCFGALGGILGMYVFRHKTKRWYFRLFFPAMLIAQAIILAILYFYV